MTLCNSHHNFFESWNLSNCLIYQSHPTCLWGKKEFFSNPENGQFSKFLNSLDAKFKHFVLVLVLNQLFVNLYFLVLSLFGHVKRYYLVFFDLNKN